MGGIKHPPAKLAQAGLGIRRIEVTPVQPEFVGTIAAELLGKQGLFTGCRLPENTPLPLSPDRLGL